MLPPGTRIGSYDILAMLGAGGMGEVYRARDTQLGREIALKVLPDAFAGDTDRLTRFRREATTLASLNHPNIAAIYGLVDLPAAAGGRIGLVMELVEGEDLAQRVARGALPLEDALGIARQIADGVAGAHDQGIVHRDLKPANVKVRADGVVKVLDFGLAKAMEPAGAVAAADAMHSPTFTSPLGMTQMGLILGTAAYMAPEQAKGRPVDKRADIWAFGCVLFEMLAGRAPFSGDGVTEILAKVIEREPDWRMLPADTPLAIRRLLRRCLEKDPKRRLADIADARFELDDAASESRDSVSVGEPPSRSLTRGLVAAVALLATLTALTTWQWIRLSGSAGPPSSVETFVAATLGLDGANLTALTDRFAVSPDGTLLAFVDQTRGGLLVRRSSSLEAAPLPGAPPNAFSPVFSPDGKWIAFSTEGAVMKIPSEGGKPMLLAGGADYFVNLTWDADGRIRFPSLKFDAIRSVSDSGGPVETIAVPPRTRVSRAVGLGNGRLLVSVTTRGESQIAVREGDGTLRKIAEGWDGRLTPTGHLLFSRREGAVWSLVAAPFDAATATLRQEPSVLVRDVPVHFATPAAATAAGDVFYVGGAPRSDRRVVIIDRAGAEREAPVPRWAWVNQSVSPDGRSLALSRWEGARRTIWTLALDSGALTQITYAEDNFQPRWLPDGKRLVFANFPLDPDQRATSIWTVLTDGRGQVEPIAADWDAYPGLASSDGRTLYYEAWNTAEAQSDIRSVALGGSGARPTVVLSTPAEEQAPVPSPDGRWLAYKTNASGVAETRVAPLADMTASVQVSAAGGTPVRWSPDSSTLYFTDGKTMAALTVGTHGPVLSSRRTVFTVPADTRGQFDVMPDGTRGVVIRGGLIYSDIVVVQHALRRGPT